MIKIRNPRDFWSGVMFVAFGGAGLWLAKAFSYGTAARMGPAYFPTAVAGLLAAFGLGIALRALAADGKRVGRFHFKTLLPILASLSLFGLALEPIGLFGAVFILVVLASLGGNEFRMRETVLVSAGLAIGTVLLFVYALKLQIPIWPSF
jgi:hypothetical protein